MKQTIFIPLLLIMLLFSIQHTAAQEKTTKPRKALFEIGESLVSIAQSDDMDKMDKIVNIIDSDIDVDKKAEIVESFITVKEALFNIIGKNNVKLFNVIKQNKFTYFILTYNNRFLFIRSKTNDYNYIVDVFTMMDTRVSEKLQLGKKIFNMKCFSCHGKEGKGLIGPNLTDNYWKNITREDEIIDFITNGRKGVMMLAYKDYLKPEEIEAVALYVKALQGKKLKKSKKPEGKKINIPFHIFNN